MYADTARRDEIANRPAAERLTRDRKLPVPAPPPTRTSELLCAFANSRTQERVSIGEIVEALGDRGLGVILAAFAVPNVLPSTVPFGNVLTGIPVIVIAAQLMMGMERLYLPRFLARRTISTVFIKAWTPRVTRLLAWFERLLKPRFSHMMNADAERAIGTLCMVLSIATTLPIPFGHQLPALGIMLIGLGLIERDGLALLAGTLIGLVGVLLLALALFGLAHGAHHLMHLHHHTH